MDDNHIVTHIPWPPKIAVVIGTYGSPAYIRLQLESRKRFWPDAPVLIHDDDSPERDELMRICNEYGALYYSPSKRSENVGDMAAVVKGIDWAHEISCDIVVKISRRFIIIHEWLDAFRTLAYSTQYPTYAGHCAEYLYPCRSECVAFHVDSWRSSESMQRMRTGIKNGENPNGKLTMEQWYHQQAKEILNSSASVQVRSMRGAFRVKSDAIGCQYWPLAGFSRHLGFPGVIWHNSDYPEDYYYLAKSYGFDDLPIEIFRNIYAPRDDFHPLPHKQPPISFPSIKIKESTFCDQLNSIENLGFYSAKKSREYAQIIGQSNKPANFNSHLLEARLTHKIDIAQFDIIRWIRTITLQPYVISKAFYDTTAVSSIWRKSTLKDATLEPRIEAFCRYLCQKAAEHTGQILAFGSLPSGMSALVGRVFSKRHRVLNLSDDILTGSIDQATTDLNNWGNLSVYFHKIDGFDWINYLSKIDFSETSLIVLNIAGKSAQLLSALEALTQRDRPTIVVCQPKRHKEPSDDLAEVTRIFNASNYSYAIIGMAESCDGIFYPYSPNAAFGKRAIFAWPNSNGNSLDDLT